MDYEFSEEQQAAIEGCLNLDNRIVPVTGPGGVGKTTIIEAAARAQIKAGYQVICCAPTGRAAKNIQERTGIPAVTNHRLLEYGYPGDRDEKTGHHTRESYPKKGVDERLTYDIIYADEYAMVNQEINRNLLDAMKPGSVIRPIGDINQLKPIETDKRIAKMPSAFKTMLENFPSHRLNKIYRTGEGSGITANAELVLQGRPPRRNNDCDIKFTDSPIRVLEELILDAQGAGVDYTSLDHQVITLTNKNWIGILAINGMMQKALNDRHPDEQLQLPRHTWHTHKVAVGIGDKIVFKKNVYATEECPHFEVFNGEIGTVSDVNDYGEVTVDLGDRVVVCPPIINYIDRQSGEIRSFDPRKDIELAYAITTHGAQGSQYKNVVYILNKSNFVMQCRANLYTAITRASQHCTILTDQRSISNAAIRVTPKIEEMN